MGPRVESESAHCPSFTHTSYMLCDKRQQSILVVVALSVSPLLLLLPLGVVPPASGFTSETRTPLPLRIRPHRLLPRSLFDHIRPPHVFDPARRTITRRPRHLTSTKMTSGGSSGEDDVVAKSGSPTSVRDGRVLSPEGGGAVDGGGGGKRMNATTTTTALPRMTVIVAASGRSRGIGRDGDLPWKLPGDMRYFREVTTSPPSPGLTNAVIMGRKTWESIPSKFRPLKGRINVVLSRRWNESDGCDDGGLPEGVIKAGSLREARESIAPMDNAGTVFVIGGGQIYEEAMRSGDVGTVLLTEVTLGESDEDAGFDAFFPKLEEDGTWDCRQVHVDGNEAGKPIVDEKSGYSYRFLEYSLATADVQGDREESVETKGGANGFTTPVKKKPSSSSTNNISPNPPAVADNETVEGAHVNPDEMQYLNLCRDILTRGVKRGDRTGTGTLSIFGAQMRFSLRENTMPLLTTKRTFWRGLAEELLWFIAGNTNANELADKDVHIWDGNGSREFLDARGLSHREVGDLGPVYGFQWRHFGATYVDMHTDYTGQGVDQLAECIRKIKNTPEDRRIIMSAWNPADLDKMALPPCHMFCQFYVDTERGELSCQMYQRSADMGLGVPFNIASYALLTHMVAQVCGLKAGDFVHTIGDAHVYLNHVDALKEQLNREPRAFPKIRINPDKKTDIDDFVFEDFELVGYKPHKTIKMKMAV